MKTGPRFLNGERREINAGCKTMAAQGHSIAEIATHYRISYNYVREILLAAQRPNPAGHRVCEEIRQTARQRFTAGHRVTEIAFNLNVSTTAIYRWCKGLDRLAAA